MALMSGSYHVLSEAMQSGTPGRAALESKSNSVTIEMEVDAVPVLAASPAECAEQAGRLYDAFAEDGALPRDALLKARVLAYICLLFLRKPMRCLNQLLILCRRRSRK